MIVSERSEFSKWYNVVLSILCKLIPAELTLQTLLIFIASMLVKDEPVQRIFFDKVSLEWFKGVGSVEENHSVATG